jgi:phospholipid transport system substrate-binding protein
MFRALAIRAQTASRLRPSERSAKFSLTLAALAVALALSGGFAAAANDPMTAVKQTVSQVLSIVKDPAYKSATAERREKLREIIAPHFDFADMSRSALGYHWRTLSQAQREQFVNLFTGLLEASYMGKIEGYSGQKIDYIKETRDGDYAQVNTNIVSHGNEPILVNYRLKQSAGNWKVYDVLVDQISLVGNYRNQFNRIINAKGYATLIQAIKRKKRQIDSAGG